MIPTVYFATPTKTGEVSGPFATSWAKTQALCHRLGWGFFQGREASTQTIEIARSILAKHFLETRATHLFFIDADMGWEEQSIERMVRFGVPMVGAHYCKRLHDWDAVDRLAGRGVPAMRIAAKVEPSLATRTEGGKTTLVKHATLPIVAADFAPGGFQCWERSAIQKLVDHFGPTDTINDIGHPLYPEPFDLVTIFDFRRVKRMRGGVMKTIREGEDVTVCRRWRELGGDVWLDVDARFEHMGACSYYSPSLSERWRDEKALRAYAAAHEPPARAAGER